MWYLRTSDKFVVCSKTSDWIKVTDFDNYYHVAVLVPSARGEIISNTAENFHGKYKTPKIINDNEIIEAVSTIYNTLLHALSNNKSTLRTLHSNHAENIEKLSSILTEIVSKREKMRIYLLS